MKRIHDTHVGGFGLLTVIALLAVLAIGGAVAYGVFTDAEVKTTTDADSEASTGVKKEGNAAVRAEVVAKIRAVKEETAAIMNDLQTKLALDAKVQLSVDAFADAKQDIAEVYASADAEAKIELNKLRAQIAQVEARLSAKGEAAAAQTKDAQEYRGQHRGNAQR